ncbi:MAG: hypothetical protein ABWK00_01220 [Desulfurococcaceae archaeon]
MERLGVLEEVSGIVSGFLEAFSRNVPYVIGLLVLAIIAYVISYAVMLVLRALVRYGLIRPLARMGVAGRLAESRAPVSRTISWLAALATFFYLMYEFTVLLNPPSGAYLAAAQAFLAISRISAGLLVMALGVVLAVASQASVLRASRAIFSDVGALGDFLSFLAATVTISFAAGYALYVSTGYSGLLDALTASAGPAAVLAFAVSLGLAIGRLLSSPIERGLRRALEGQVTRLEELAKGFGAGLAVAVVLLFSAAALYYVAPQFSSTAELLLKISVGGALLLGGIAFSLLLPSYAFRGSPDLAGFSRFLGAVLVAASVALALDYVGAAGSAVYGAAVGALLISMAAVVPRAAFNELAGADRRLASLAYLLLVAALVIGGIAILALSLLWALHAP